VDGGPVTPTEPQDHGHSLEPKEIASTQSGRWIRAQSLRSRPGRWFDRHGLGADVRTTTFGTRTVFHLVQEDSPSGQLIKAELTTDRRIRQDGSAVCMSDLSVRVSCLPDELIVIHVIADATGSLWRPTTANRAVPALVSSAAEWLADGAARPINPSKVNR
jgi:hypothetical protein